MWIRTHDNKLIDTGGAVIYVKGSKLTITVQGVDLNLASYMDRHAAVKALDDFQSHLSTQPITYEFKNEAR